MLTQGCFYAHNWCALYASSFLFYTVLHLTEVSTQISKSYVAWQRNVTTERFFFHRNMNPCSFAAETSTLFLFHFFLCVVNFIELYTWFPSAPF